MVDVCDYRHHLQIDEKLTSSLIEPIEPLRDVE